MSVLYTNGQSWEKIAADFTLSPSYAPAIAIQNNMPDDSITGKRFRIEIPDTWMKPEYSGKEINLAKAGMPGAEIVSGIPNWMLGVIAEGVLFVTMK